MREFDRLRLIGLLTRPRTVLRHDVDYSITAAISMARLEEALGVTSRYYIMTSSPFYTPTDAFGLAQVLVLLGHEIGWHVDPRETPPATFANNVVRMPVSWHCPRPSELWKRFPGVESAYDPIWRGSYYADSRGRFAHGDPEDHDSAGYIQVNLHPEWWFESDWHLGVDEDEYAAFWHEPKSALSQPVCDNGEAMRAAWVL